MAALWMEFGDDLAQNQNGGLLLAYNADEVRQAICRDLLTTPALTLDDGTTVQAEYIWDTTFGAGARVFIGQNASSADLNALKQRATNSILKNPGVNATIQPTFTFTKTGQATYMLAGYQLANGSKGSLALQVGG